TRQVVGPRLKAGHYDGSRSLGMSGWPSQNCDRYAKRNPWQDPWGTSLSCIVQAGWSMLIEPPCPVVEAGKILVSHAHFQLPETLYSDDRPQANKGDVTGE